jgi:dihydrodipicolinate synthase/N-acetylneuraminate lyase
VAGLTADIRGVWATVLLRVREDGGIDLDAIAGQVAAHAPAGVDGVYCNGTATEFHCQTEEQFEAVSRATASAARAAGLPFQIGAAHPLPHGALSRVALAASLMPAAIQVTLPDWTPVDLDTAIRFLRACAETADGVPLVLYNPPHARTALDPRGFARLAESVPALAGIKCGGGDDAWYAAMAPVFDRLSVFIPGHHYATGVLRGAHGSYSNMACLSPTAATRWAVLTRADPDAARSTEVRIAAFMAEAIAPILAAGHQGYAVDKAMAAAGGWTPITPRLLWPCAGLGETEVARIAAAARRHIPEFVEASADAGA